MGFNQTQRVVDAWAATKDLRGEWGFLLWLARHCDQESGEIRRSQGKLAEELGVSTRWVREYLRRWKERGVVEVLRHGGGPKRTVAVLKVSVRSLEDYTIRLAFQRKAKATQEAQGVPQLGAESVERKSAASAVPN
jgi:hypothetical protein